MIGNTWFMIGIFGLDFKLLLGVFFFLIFFLSSANLKISVF